MCLYCDTFDGDFFIDRHPDKPWLVVASGGSGHAFKFAPLLGRWIAEPTLGAPPPVLRFAWRERTASRFEDARYRGPA